MFPILQLGPFALQVAQVALVAGTLLAAWLVEREAARRGLPAAAVWQLVVLGLVTGLVGARLGYVASYRSVYAADPLAIFSPSVTALTPEVGIVVGAIAAGIYGQRRALPLRPTLDALAPGLTVLALAMGVANLASGDGYGAPAHLPWSIYLWSAERHPSQVYEILAALAVFGVWLWLRRWRLTAGSTFLLVVALSAAARVFLEAFRGDSQLLPGGVRAAQVWGLVALALCLWVLHIWNRDPIVSEPSQLSEPSQASQATGEASAVPVKSQAESQLAETPDS
jgi:phosphatidylglycerol---prolipoprotein diacylglyceryl transferase